MKINSLVIDDGRQKIMIHSFSHYVRLKISKSKSIGSQPSFLHLAKARLVVLKTSIMYSAPPQMPLDSLSLVLRLLTRLLPQLLLMTSSCYLAENM